ncbi:MAG: tyrosine-type recombinase/integrase [Prevotella sp.]|nr:tyrosine-type recombinase/integrase [Prevotella sp.]
MDISRHSFAMALLNKGTDIYTIAKLMGHRSVTSTQVYAKLSDEQLRKAIHRL